ncbi:DUF1569 domain-containing protein [Sphingobacterium multivorum]|uniref:DUF1569 domain-containing protein n=1 Tax=Sphingobacterium multivorum TaxID=28454 RepID=UPI003018B21B
MKSIFEKNIREAVVERINLLNEDSDALWGKMTVTQMVKHCILCEQHYQGSIKVKRSFLGRMVGQDAIKGILKDEITSFGKNAPTSAVFIVNEDIHYLEIEKPNWKLLIDKYETFEKDTFLHRFFGRISRAQLGQFIYKHCNHHLKQFGA